MGRESRRRQHEIEGGPDEHATYGFYLVAFLDVLGQTEALRRLKSLPFTQEALPAAVDLLRTTVGRVRAVRDAFDNYLAIAREKDVINPAIPAEYRKRLEGIADRKFTQRGFSDCFVITAPLFGEGDPVRAIRDIFAVLHGIAGMCLVSMAQGKFLRGGVDVERGIEIYPGELYGPGLLCAYELEKNEAHYPRVLIGDGLINYLASLRGLDISDQWLAYGRTLAGEIERLICPAPDDGKRMVHMLSPAILELGEPMKVSAAQAFERVKAERSRFRADESVRLEAYYGRLVQYFNAFGFVE
jgi:hypothetical protein